MKSLNTGKRQISVKTCALLAAASALGISLGVVVESTAEAAGNDGCPPTTVGSNQQKCGPTATAIKIDSQQHKTGANQIKWNSQQHKLDSQQHKVIEWNNANSNQIKWNSQQHKIDSNQIKWGSQQHKIEGNSHKTETTGP